jgi:hypothetical protein
MRYDSADDLRLVVVHSLAMNSGFWDRAVDRLPADDTSGRATRSADPRASVKVSDGAHV